jgi:hypothetical protein
MNAFPMNKLLAAALTSLAVLGGTAPARAMSLSDACATFASKLNSALQAGDTAKAQEIYSVGSQRIAGRFNGATCPNVKAPAAANN